MNERSKKLKSILILSIVTVILVIVLIGIFIFPTYKFAFISLMFIFATGISFYAGVKEVQINEVSLPWWRCYFIVLALTWLSWSGMLLVSNFVYIQGSNVLTGSILIFFVLLSLSLSVYSVALSWQRLKRRRGLNNV